VIAPDSPCSMEQQEIGKPRYLLERSELTSFQKLKNRPFESATSQAP
jgi:hypothetical protein